MEQGGTVARNELKSSDMKVRRVVARNNKGWWLMNVKALATLATNGGLNGECNPNLRHRIITAKRLRLEAQGCFNPGITRLKGDQPGTGCDRGRNRFAVGPINLILPRVAAAATLGFET